jgi:acyl-coenzyme A thioesterase PaaI-like protein
MSQSAPAAAGGAAEDRPAYPPERHFLRDLDSTSLQLAADRNLMTAPVTDGMRNAAGAAALGMLATLVDIAAAPVALIAGAPDWTATQDMALHATGWLTEGPAVATAQLVRAGQNTVVVSVAVHDGRGTSDLDELAAALEGPAGAGDEADEVDGSGPRRVAKGLLTFARIPRSASASANVFKPEELVGQRRSMSPLQPPEGTMFERIGVEVVDAAAGVVEIHRSDYVRNSFGTINGGVLGAVFQAAAEATRPELVATDVQIHYLSQVKVGPARTTAEVSRDAAGHSVVTVTAVDAGNDDTILALATVTLQAPPR